MIAAMCIYICVYIYVCVYIYIYIYIYTHTQIDSIKAKFTLLVKKAPYTITHIYIHTHIHTYIHVYKTYIQRKTKNNLQK
jgi:hypothetical protein